MIVYQCDLCRKRMTANDSGRYIVRLEAFAAAEPLEIRQSDRNRDHTLEIRELIDTLAQQSQDQVEDSVYRNFRYDLCSTCHAIFLSQPKPGLSGTNPGD